METGVACVAAITVICYLVGLAVGISGVDNRLIPIICGVTGAILGAVALYTGLRNFPADDLMTAVAVGIVSGLAATGADQVYKQLGKE